LLKFILPTLQLGQPFKDDE